MREVPIVPQYNVMPVCPTVYVIRCSFDVISPTESNFVGRSVSVKIYLVWIRD